MRYYIDKSVLLNDIKVVAFDFDETFYSAENMRELYLNYIKKTFKKLCGFDDKKTKKVMHSLGYTLESKTAPSFSQICTNFGVSDIEYHKYRITNYFEIDYTKAEIVSNETLERFAKFFNLYIVSNEINTILESKITKINLNKALFKGIYSTPITATKTNSKDIPYLDIIHREHIKPSELLVIGDRFKVDIEPAIELGANGILIDKPRDLISIISQIEEQKNINWLKKLMNHNIHKFF